MSLHSDAQLIIQNAIQFVQPDHAVKAAVSSMPKDRKLHLVAVGKAAWQMAKSAWDCLGSSIADGIVITKHHHSLGAIGSLSIYEAGHPVPDADTFTATKAVEAFVKPLGQSDLVLFLLSGGGSALFEDPLVSPEEMADITKQLLDCGADIVQMNTIRKRLSGVKGGRFAQLCAPAQVYTVVLSDVVGDRLDMIASGPTYPDASTCEEALAIAKQYQLKLSDAAIECLKTETPKALSNVQTVVTGSVRQLCVSASETARSLGYRPVVLTSCMTCLAKEVGSFLASVAKEHSGDGEKLAILAGGETVVHHKGNGLGGRNQEIALSAAEGLDGISNVVLFSFGSDGTDGPTDAAGGIVDGTTRKKLLHKGYRIAEVLADNDSYHALEAVDCLIKTGPTGTNVNDLTVLLISDT